MLYIILRHNLIFTVTDIRNIKFAAKSLQPCPTLCDPIDGSPKDSPVPGILQARTRVGCHFLLQYMKVKSESEVAQSCPTLSDKFISYNFPFLVCSFSIVQLFVTSWTIACQTPLSIGLSKEEYCSGLPILLQGIFPTHGSNPCLLCLLHWQADSLPLGHQGSLPSLSLVIIFIVIFHVDRFFAINY